MAVTVPCATHFEHLSATCSPQHTGRSVLGSLTRTPKWQHRGSWTLRDRKDCLSRFLELSLRTCSCSWPWLSMSPPQMLNKRLLSSCCFPWSTSPHLQLPASLPWLAAWSSREADLCIPPTQTEGGQAVPRLGFSSLHIGALASGAAAPGAKVWTFLHCSSTGICRLTLNALWESDGPFTRAAVLNLECNRI